MLGMIQVAAEVGVAVRWESVLEQVRYTLHFLFLLGMPRLVIPLACPPHTSLNNPHPTPVLSVCGS